LGTLKDNANPQGTRNGKIVVVEADGSWLHERIELVPKDEGLGLMW